MKTNYGEFQLALECCMANGTRCNECPRALNKKSKLDYGTIECAQNLLKDTAAIMENLQNTQKGNNIFNNCTIYINK